MFFIIIIIILVAICIGTKSWVIKNVKKKKVGWNRPFKQTFPMFFTISQVWSQAYVLMVIFNHLQKSR